LHHCNVAVLSSKGVDDIKGSFDREVYEKILETLKSKYAERHNVEVEQIDIETLDILTRRACRICNKGNVIDEKTDESDTSSDNTLPAFG